MTRLIPLLLPLLLFTACTDDPPPAPPTSTDVFLSLVEADYTTVRLKLTLTPPDTTGTALLLRSGSEILSMNLDRSDTTLLVDGLRPGTDYTFLARRVRGGRVTAESAPLRVRTLDTSSHDFEMQTFELGDGGGSLLRDVFILNDTLAYAVGEILTKDSAGEWEFPAYNLAKWNGVKWELKRVSVNYKGNLITPPLYGIRMFSETDIWLTSGIPIHGDGERWEQYHLFDDGVLKQTDGSLWKIWGLPGKLYFVGNRGTIAMLDGATWKRIESGTTTAIQDIWGQYDETTGKYLILCAVSNSFVRTDKKVMRIHEDGQVEDIPWPSERNAYSIWFSNKKKWFAAGDGVLVRTEPKIDWAIQDLPLLFKRKVRGVADNDVFVCGDFGMIYHFSGLSWNTRQVSGFQFYSCTYKNNMFIAVGFTSIQKACIAMLKRK